MTFREFFKLDFLTDRVGMVLAILVSLGTVTLMFVIITPDFPPFRIIMGVMGAVLVLFSPRALAKNKMKLWHWIASIIVFCEVSTGLVMTDIQSHETKNNAVVVIDPVLSHLQSNTQSASDKLQNIIDQQATAQTRATLDALATQFTLLTDIYNNAVAMEKSYIGTTKPITNLVDPNKLVMAIPDAIMSMNPARWITFLLLLAVAIIFQAVIKATVKATVKHTRAMENGTGRKRRRRRPKVAVAVEEPILEPTE